MNSNILKLFIYTVSEYKRMFNINTKKELLDDYDEKEYRDVNTKLMMLRKYGCYSDNVHIEKVLKAMIEKYDEHKEELEEILEEYKKIEQQQFEYILPDGKKFDLYKTIEDTMYGLYLHADENRINNLMESEERLRFICIRKYVQELETIVLNIYDKLKEYGEEIKNENSNEKASTIYLGDPSHNSQNINNCSYWSNLYGKDGNTDDIVKILDSSNKEDLIILCMGNIFIDEIKKEEKNYTILNNLIYPLTSDDWGDFSEATNFYNSIKNPGLSSKVRYNDEHNMAYIRILPNVDGTFIIDTPHIISGLYEICFAKYNGEWKIYSLGGHLESIFK